MLAARAQGGAGRPARGAASRVGAPCFPIARAFSSAASRRLTLAVGFNPRCAARFVITSRQRRLNTTPGAGCRGAFNRHRRDGEISSRLRRALKHTAKFKAPLRGGRRWKISMFERNKEGLTKSHLRLIRVIGVIVPRRLRADWRQ